MSFALTDLRSDIDALLANAVDAATWTDALKDGAIREALLIYSLRGPAFEADVVVTLAGHEQELGVLPGLLVIEAIAWPWHDGLLIEDQAVGWRIVGPSAVRMDRVAPQVGDILRVRYRRTHTVAGLDGAAQTNVPDSHRGLLAEGAAAAALALRIRQVSENPAIPAQSVAVLRAEHQRREAQFTWLLEQMQGGSRLPVWAAIDR